MGQNPFHVLLGTALVMSALAVQGCGTSSTRHDLNRAQAALDQVLDSWARGEAPTRYADDSEAIRATDPDWKAGYRLLSFLSVDAKPIEEKPGHVLCRVSLVLKEPKGKQVEKEVTYHVQVGDKVIIERKS